MRYFRFGLAAFGLLVCVGFLRFEFKQAHSNPPPPPPAARLRLPPVGELYYEVRDAATGQPMPAKITLLGVDGTPDPEWTRGDIGRQEGAAIAAYNKLLSASGTGAIYVAQGTYDIYISRGPEWDLFIARRVQIPATGVEVRATLRHVVDTTNWLSADFHVHSSCSTDSHVPMRDRVFEFVADGVDMIVSTDHNVVCDYAPLIGELDLGRYLMSAAGDELTTAGWGHFGIFPLPQDIMRSGHGAIHVSGRTPVEMFKEAHGMGTDALVDVHHPRIDGEIGYFQRGEFDAQNDRAGRPGFSYDFDAIEVLNGYQDAERRHIDQVVADWFALLDHGHIVTATGNSDTHHLNYNLGGYPRNYVRVKDDRPQVATPSEIARSVKAHHSFFTTAPFVRFHIDGADIGDTVRVRKGRVRAEITVEAAPWVSISTVKLYVNGQEYKGWKVLPSPSVVRFSGGTDLSITRDSYVVLRVDGDKVLAPIIGDRKRFDVHPLAITNPIFLDVDGNGRFDAPLAHGTHQ